MRVRASVAPVLASIGIWLGLGTAVAACTRRVADWFVMTDELLYERLALSIARTHSVLPYVHGVRIGNVNQLYPVLLAFIYGRGAIPSGFHDAHVINAFAMSSVALPAALLARRVTQNGWLSVFVAAATITVPWIVLSSFLLTEVLAYPAFVWALLAMHAAVSRPSVRTDLVAAVAIAIAVLARVQFYGLVIALPIAILAHGVAARRLRATVRAHSVLCGLYAAALGAVVVISLGGYSPLGTYAQTTSGNPVPLSLLRAVPAHIAIVALAGGLLPVLLGGAWIVCNLRPTESPECFAFAWLALATIAVLSIEVASFDERFGGGIVRERYLFYLIPVFLISFAAALVGRGQRWSILAPLGVLTIGFCVAPLPTFEKLNVDTPAAILNDWLLTALRSESAVRVFLVTATVVLALVFVEGSALLPPAAFSLVLCVLVLAATAAETAYAFERLFAVDGTSGLPLTLDQSVVFGWVDREITANSEAMIVPYPIVRADYLANVAFWWDLEFWNASVDREGLHAAAFSSTTAGSFPKVDLRFDSQTGRASIDADSYIAQAAGDARFHVKGRYLTTQRDVSIVFPDRPWRADWVSYGLYADGWTRPRRAARIRVFADAQQRGSSLRSLKITVSAPEGVTRITRLQSNRGDWTIPTTSDARKVRVTVCVPGDGYADVTLRTRGTSPIYGDPSNARSFAEPRRAGVLVAQVALADKLFLKCPTSR